MGILRDCSAGAREVPPSPLCAASTPGRSFPSNPAGSTCVAAAAWPPENKIDPTPESWPSGRK